MLGWVPLINRWEQLRRSLAVADSKTGESWYRLPAELRSDKWGVDHLNIFLAQWLKRLEVVAPEGFSYSWHSLRHMAASSCAAINVHIARVKHLQGWKTFRTPMEVYTDPLCPPTPGCYRLYGWMLPPGVPPAPSPLVRG